MKLFIYLVLFLIFCFYSQDLLFGQIAPSLQLQKALGGTYDDKLLSIISLPNNKIVIAGNTESNDGDIINVNGGDEFWIIQLDSNLNIEWSKCFGGHYSELANSVISTLDGGFVLAGWSDSDDGDVTSCHGTFDQDIWLVKIDSLRNIQWDHCYGGTYPDKGVEIISTTDSGYFLIASAESYLGPYFISNRGGEDVWVSKLDTSGNITWAKCLGGTNWDTPQSCIQTQDGGYLIAGSTQSNDMYVTGLHGTSPDAWVVRLDNQGNELWNKCYGGTGIENGQKILPASGNGFYLISTTSSHDGDVSSLVGDVSMWLVRADSTGTVLWEKCFGAEAADPRDAIITSDGGIVMAGFSLGDTSIQIPVNNGYMDFTIIKVDGLGNFEWGNAFGGSEEDVAYSICESPNRNLFLAGWTKSTDGQVVNTHPGTLGDGEGWVVKLSPLPLLVSEYKNPFNNLSIFQNNDQLTARLFSTRNENAKFSLYDISGRVVGTKNVLIKEGVNIIGTNSVELSSGLYFVEITSILGSVRGKCLLSRFE